MTKAKARQFLKIANLVSKYDKGLAHDIQIMVMGATTTPHKPKKVNCNFIDSLKIINEKLKGHDFAIVGGFAVRHWVEIRETDDIDIAILAKDWDFIKQQFPKGTETPLVYTVEVEGTNIDFMYADVFPWTVDAIRTAVIKKESGIPIKIVLPEYLILYKMKAQRGRDISDIKELLKLKGIYKKSKNLVEKYFSKEDLEDFEQLTRESEYGA